MSKYSSHLGNLSTRRQVYVQRYGLRQAEQLEIVLRRIENQIIKEMQTVTVSRLSRSQQIASLIRVRTIMKKSLYDMGNQITMNMREFLEVEADFTYSLLDSVVRVDTVRPSREQLDSAFKSKMNAPVGSTLTVEQAVNQFANNKSAEMVQIFRDGFITGRTTVEMTQDIVNATDMQVRHAEALVRTATNHMAAQARKATEAANSDTVDGFEVVATLDSRTTLICAGLDGKHFPFDGKRPPYHWSCRTTTVPYVKPEFRIPNMSGDRPAKGAEGVELVSGDTSYSGWLRKQPAAFQDDVLGKSRGALFRRGGVKIEQFTDRRGATYTLDDLKRNNKSAFEKANL